MLTMLLVSVLALQDDSADAWVKRLGDEAYAEREKATEELRKLGRAAEPALRKALESPDAEVRRRAQGLLDELAKPRRGPRLVPPGLQGFRGSSVQVQSVNGDSTYVITPGDGSPALTFRKWAAGKVELEYRDEQGEKKTAEAASLGEFLKEQAGLAEKYGVTEEGIAYGGARVSFKGGVFSGAPFRWDFGRRTPKPAEPPREDFEPLGEALRAQLELPEGRGVLVSRDGALPGLLKHDILLEADGQAVGGPSDARRLGASAAAFTVLRKGKRETVKAERKDF